MKSIISLLIIFLAASLFRLTNLDLIEFKTDEAINIYLAAQPIFGHPFPPGGTVSSVGILNPPLFNYFLFPLIVFTRNPVIISFAIALINVVAICLFFVVIRRFYGNTTAWITSLLIAFSPWAIVYSRKIWMQNFLLPFFVVFFFAYHKIIVENKLIYWAVLTASSLFLIQLHQASIIFIILFAFFLIFQKIKFDIRYIIIGIIIGLIPLTHYFLYEVQNRCPDCKAVFATKNKLSLEKSYDNFKRAFQITGQGNFNYIFGVNDFLTFKNQYKIAFTLRMFLYITYILLPLGFFIAIKYYKNLWPFSLSALFLPVAYYILHLEPFMHYFIIVMPLLFLFIALGIAHFSNLGKKYRALSFILLSFFIICLLLFDYAFFSILKNKEYLGGDYGATYKKQQIEINIRLNQYHYLKHPEQGMLVSYIPLRFMYGFLPLGKILYPQKYSEERLRKLEYKWRDRPDDWETKFAIFTVLTKTPPTQKNIDFLFQKKATLPLYEELYNEAEGYFRSQNFLRKYVSEDLGMRLYYPEHWRAEENDKGILLINENSQTIIEKISSSSFDMTKQSTSENTWDFDETAEINGNEITMAMCTTSDFKLCGLTFYPFYLKNQPYSITYIINQPTIHLAHGLELEKRKEVILRLIGSIRPE